MADSAGHAETLGGPSRGDRRSDARLAMPELVQCYYRLVYGYAYRLTGNACDAEDLSQQTFLVAQRKQDQVRDWSKVDRWLLTITRTCFLKGLRRKRPLTGIELPVDEIPDRADEQQIDEEQLQAALNTLPDEFRLVVTMFYFESLSYRQIATELDLPIGTVMSRLARAKGRLRRSLFVPGEEGRSQGGLVAASPHDARAADDPRSPESNRR